MTKLLQVSWLLLLFLLCPAPVCSRLPMALPTSTPAVVAGTAARTTRPGCPSMCGNISIPYPFGIGKKCSRSKFFTISCNHSYDPPRAYYGRGGIEVIDIKLKEGEMRVFTPIAYLCFNSSYNTSSVGDFIVYNLTRSPTFLISPERNEFTGVGCNNVALLQGNNRNDYGGYLSGCITTCASLDDAANDGDPCSGNGCCQTAMPGGLNLVMVGWSIGDDTRPVNSAWNYSSCNYGFIAEKGWYNFSRKHLSGTGQMSLHRQLGDRTVPLVLDWAVLKDGACKSSHSEPKHIIRDDHPWYRCNCLGGYAGNPYVPGGCQNINECQDPTLYSCPSASKCVDTDGHYKCKCNFGRKKPDCRPIFPATAAAVLATFVASVLLVLLLWIVHREHKRLLRRSFFDRNGGKILKGVDINIFAEGEMVKITNNYSSIIGKGAFGEVFMGTTEDNQKVAVKRPVFERDNKGQHQRQGGEFVDEITFQFQIRHENLVRLVGCCLETDVPMLVFEYIPRGSLYDVLHGVGAGNLPMCSLSLTERLDIAIGSAEALAYMHSHTSHHNRIHGDVKSGNILLDDGLKPKLSDFGSSKLVSIASRYAVWCVSGDMNYIDPDYIRTGCFTEKSDIYSFGVVLLELVTRKKAKYDGSNSLPMNFVRLCKKDGNGRNMYDRDIVLSDRHTECVDRIGALAIRCLKEDVHDRPTMAEVVEELKLVKLRACGASKPRLLSFMSASTGAIIREPSLVQLQGNIMKQKDLCLTPGGTIRNRHSRGCGQPEEVDMQSSAVLP